MTELMIKMTSWLVGAMALGFLVAWFLSRIIYKRKQCYEEDVFSAAILERNNMIEKLEQSFRNKKLKFENLSEELKKSKEALDEKTSRLTTLQNKLDNRTSNENSNLLLKKIQKLEESDIKRIKELEDFGEIVLLAEEQVAKNEKNHRQILEKLGNNIEYLTSENEKYKNYIKVYQKTITDFEESLKLYEADSSEAEFIISKDQFLKIEEQLHTYQKEIKSLKHELTNDHRNLEDKIINESENESDDGSMVKAFRETYNKITKI